MVLLSGTSLAQRIAVRDYTMTDGLPSAQVESIAQDGAGTMWFLTRLGIASYDGANWNVESYPRVSPQRLSYMSADARGQLWVYSGDQCWSRTEAGWEELPSPPVDSTRIVQIVSIGDGAAARRVAGGARDQMHVFDGASWTTTEVGTGDEITWIRALTAMGTRCLIGTSRGVIEFDAVTGTLDRWELDLPDTDLSGLCYDARRDTLWVAGKSWIARVDCSAGAREVNLVHDHPELLRTGLSVRYFCGVDLSGGLYLGDDFSLHYFHHETGLERVGLASGMTTEGVNGVFCDREGNIWTSAARGVNKIVSRRFKTYDKDHGLFEDEVSAAVERADGSIVLGHNGGLTLLGSNPEVISFSDEIVRPRVMDLAEDDDGVLWAATGYLGLGRLGPDGLEIVLDREASGGLLGTLASIAPVGSGMWLGSDRGLFWFEEGVLTPVPLTPEDGEPTSVRRVVRDGADSVLVATIKKGLFSIDEDHTVRRWTHSDFAVYSTFTVLRHSDGTIWGGAKGGLVSTREGGRLELADHPRIRRPVYALTEDQDGCLWIGTDAGLLRWDGSTLLDYGTGDGVIGSESNRGAAFVDRAGRTWFGTNSGISVYDERFDEPRVHGPSVRLLDMEVGGSLYPLNSDARLPHDSRALTFRFAGISFMNEDRLRFQTRLVGFDDEWSIPSIIPNREIRYTNLSPGEYRFQIRAIDIEGVVSPATTSASVVVQKPIWKIPWFIAAEVLLGLAIVAGFLRYWSQRRYALRLENEVSVRTAEIREMERERENHERIESIGLLAGGIAHDFNNILTAIVGNVVLLKDRALPEGSAVVISDVENGCWKARELSNQLLTFARGGAPIREATSLAELIRESSRFVLRGSSVKCEFDLPEDLATVEVDSGQVNQVITNLLINARQAMPGGGIVRVSARNLQPSHAAACALQIEVTDGGGGISQDVIGRVFDPYFSTKGEGHGLGLTTARSIIERHGGELSVSSPPGQGATFCMTLPASDVVSPLPKEEPTGRSLLHRRIMVMDDDPSVRVIIRRILEQQRCTVLEAPDGAEAVRLYRESLINGPAIDAVVMDLTVPGGMGGIEASAKVRELDSDARIIVASGYSDDPALSELHVHGFAARLKKPFKPETLVRTLYETLGGAREDVEVVP